MMRRLLAVMMVLTMLVSVGTAAEMGATISPGDPDSITLDADNNYEVSKTFDGSLSDGQITDYNWENDDNSQSDTGSEATFTFNRDEFESNTVEIQLTVSNSTHSNFTTVDQNLFDVPEVTISASGSTSIDEGDSVTFTSSVTNQFHSIDARDWTIDGTSEGSGESFEHTFDSSGDYDVELSVSDSGGDTGTSNTVTVSVSSDSGGDDTDDTDDTDDSSSSSSSPAPSVPDAFSDLLGTLRAGDTATVDIDKSDEYGVSSIDISVNTYTRDVRVNVEKLTDVPADVDVDVTRGGQRAVSHYMDISADNLGADSIDEGVITFVVGQKWIDENGIDTDSVRLERYRDGDWQELATTLVDAAETELTFEAETPGFSYFAVTGDSTETDSTTGGETDEDAGDTSDSTDSSDEDTDTSDETGPDTSDELDDQTGESTENTSMLDRVGGLPAVLAVIIVLGLIIGGVVYWKRKEQAEDLFKDLAGSR